MFGAGLTLMVTPLTATVLAAVPDDVVGLASGVNNAVARTAGLLAVAAVPLVGGLGGRGLTDPGQVLDGFATLMWSCVALLVAGAALAWLGVPAKRDHELTAQPPEYHCSTAAPPAAVTSPRRRVRASVHDDSRRGTRPARRRTRAGSVLGAPGFPLHQHRRDRGGRGGGPGPQHCNGGGIVHGGYLASLLDTATGWAVHARVPAGTSAPHVHLSVQYVRAAVPGSTLVCRAHCISVGGRIGSTEAEITQHGRVVARAVGTHAVLSR